MSATAKRKQNGTPKKPQTHPGKRRKEVEDASEDEDNYGFGEISSAEEDNANYEQEDPFKDETADERRIRLAKEYISRVEAETISKRRKVDSVDDGEEYEEDLTAEQMDRDIIAQRLKVEASELRGRVHRKVSQQLVNWTVDPTTIRLLRGHKRAVTCTVISDDEKHVYSGSKDCDIIQWDVETGKKLFAFKGGRASDKRVEGHSGSVIALALTSDGRYLASGGTDKNHLLHIWDTRSRTLVDNFKGHRDIITSLAFRIGTTTLFSGSNDRTLKIWDVENMSYIDTLYGHQSEVIAVDSLYKERAISCGTDKSVRIWKVSDETQLVFRGHTASIDCVSMLNEDQFVTGSEDGSIALWSTAKKKPSQLVKAAHQNSDGPTWITSVAAFRNSDLFASGSYDGVVHLWKAGKSEGKANAEIHKLSSIPMAGFVNSLAFSKTGRFLVAGVGQDHRLGRWESIKGAKNGVNIIPLDINIDL